MPVDFEKNSLIDSLQTNGYQTGAPGIFSWLGVTMYLTSDAIFGTLQAIAALKLGAEIIFEYNVPRELLDESGQRLHAALTAFVAARGGPQQSFFEPADLAEQVRKLGFAEISDVGPARWKAAILRVALMTFGLLPLFILCARGSPAMNESSLETGPALRERSSGKLSPGTKEDANMLFEVI